MEINDLLRLVSVPGILGGGNAIAFARLYADRYPGSTILEYQEPSGAVAGAYNSELDLGRDVLKPNADFALWTATGANITIDDSDSFTRSDTNPGGVWVDIGLATSRTYELVIAGTDGSGVIEFRNGKLGTSLLIGTGFGTFTFTAEEPELYMRLPLGGSAATIDITWPSTTVKQTNILASSVYADPANNPLSGTHSGPIVGQPGPGGYLSVEYDGATAYTYWSSVATLNSVLYPPLMSIFLAVKMRDAAIWTDNTAYVFLNWQADANNYSLLWKNTSNQLQWDYKSGGNLQSVVLAVTPADFFTMTITINEAANMTALYNGDVTGTPQAIAGTFVGNLDPATTTIGALNTTPNSVQDGWETFISYYRNYEMPQSVSKQYTQLLGITS